MNSPIYHNSDAVRSRLAESFRLGTEYLRDKKLSESELDPLCILREALLNSNQARADFDSSHFDQISMNVNFTEGSITLKDRQTGMEKTFDVLEGSNVGADEYAQFTEAIKKERGRAFLPKPSYRARRKGPDRGELPLQKKGSKVLAAFEKNFDQTAVEELSNALLTLPNGEVRKHLVRCHAAADFFYRRLGEKIEEMISSKTQQYQQPSPEATQASMNQLEKELKQLYALKAKLKQLDIYALTKVLSHYPVGGRFFTQHLNKIAGRVQNEIANELIQKKDEQRKEGRGRMSRGWNALKDTIRTPSRSQLDEGEQAYIQDVGGMFFPSRFDYRRYCIANRMQEKKEGVSDVFLKEAIAFGEAVIREDAYKADGFKKSTLFEGLKSPRVKEEMDQALDEFAKLANHAITLPEQELMHEIAIPEGATDEKKQEIANEKRGLLNQAIADYRWGINWDIKVDDLPEDPEEPEDLQPAGRSYGRLALGPAALTGLGVGVLASQGVFDPLIDGASGAVAGALTYAGDAVDTVSTVATAAISSLVDTSSGAVESITQGAGAAASGAITLVGNGASSAGALITAGGATLMDSQVGAVATRALETVAEGASGFRSLFAAGGSMALDVVFRGAVVGFRALGLWS